MLVCTPQFGRYIYNPALVPEKMFCSFPRASSNPKPEQMELYRGSLKGGAPNGRAACVLFGRVATESQLIHPQTVQLAEPMLSKTVNIHPLGAQWMRAYSMMFNIFELNVLKISAYRHGLTLRTRMVTAPGAGKRIA